MRASVNLPVSTKARGVYARRRTGLLAIALAIVGAGAYASVGASRSAPQTAKAADSSARAGAGAPHTAAAPVRPVAHLVVSAPAHTSPSWTVVARVHGQPAAWVAQRSGVTLMRLQQGLVHLDLHAGSSDGGVRGWVYGDRVNQREIHLLVAAFNGGFKLTYANVGFVSGGHVAVALKAGLASIVTYSDGSTNIGAWRQGVPDSTKTVFSVLENQYLLVDHGLAAANVSSCVIACWGETIGSRTTVARSGIGITASGQLVWAAGEELLPAGLADALIGAGAVRAVELDINPDWVAGYLYVHHPSGPTPVPVVPGQFGIAGKLLEPYSRDFLTIVANQ